MFRYKIARIPTVITQQKTTNTLSPTFATESEKTIPFNNKRFAYAYFIVQNSDDLSLLPNFSHAKDSQTLMTENNCVSVINGGYYDTQNKPLGLFQIGSTIYSRQISSDLLNGFVWANVSVSAAISVKLPQPPFLFALQTGPILIREGKQLSLTINNDTPARRMVAAINMDKHIIFLTLYNGDSVYEGPLLADLPDIVFTISSKENLGIAEAINLDGGSASAFYNPDTHLSELTPVGSIFCIK
jgi:uncharacterized protein YigE (DUF2233 family)